VTTKMPDELALIDLSSIAYPIYLTSSANPDPNYTSAQIVARVRALAGGHPHAAICVDMGRSFRHDLTPTYKANRPEREAPLHHQIDLAKEQLSREGFPIWGVRGFEADDLIASATAKALAIDDVTVLIVSSDKDLLQLVGPRVRAKSAKTGDIIDAAAVQAKFGVRPDQIRDYLTLVGDGADNIKGCRGIGEVKAAALLNQFGSLDEVYRNLTEHGTLFKPAMATALREFQPRMEEVRTLITLRTDVELPFHEIAEDRVPAAADTFLTFNPEDESEDYDPMATTPPVAPAPPVPSPVPVESAAAAPADVHTEPQEPAQAAAEPKPGPHAIEPAADPRVTLASNERVREGEVLAAVDYERRLDPQSMRDARILAKDLYDSHMFSAYGSPQAVLSTIMVGRELGLPAMASLRAVHNIEGKHSLSAQAMVAIILKSGLAEYFEPVEFTDKTCTYATKRVNGRREIAVTHTIEMAQLAWPKKDKDWERAWLASGWGRNPTDMLVARATARLARMVYPDLLAGLYTPEELEEIRLSKAA
jgi:5'-3' exonuclease